MSNSEKSAFTPPLFLGAVIMLWGYEAGHMTFAIIVAMLFEGCRFVDQRWEFEDDDYVKIWNLCVGLYIFVGVYVFIKEDVAEMVRASIRWIPVLLAPIMCAQLYGNRTRIPITTFSIVARRKRSQDVKNSRPLGEVMLINICYPYAALTLFACSAEYDMGPTFYFFASLLIGWALLAQNPSAHKVTQIALLLAVMLAGFFGQKGLHHLQEMLEKFGHHVLTSHRDTQFKNAYTSIGDLEKLKLSKKIRWRIEHTEGALPSTYLKETSYAIYTSPIWSARRVHVFSRIDADVSDDDEILFWRLQPDHPVPENAIRISGTLGDGVKLLSLPPNTRALSDLPVGSLNFNKMGAIRAENGPGGIAFYAYYGGDTQTMVKPYSLQPANSEPKIEGQKASPHDDYDLSVSKVYHTALDNIIADLDLKNAPESEVPRRVQSYFQNNYRYSLDLAAENLQIEDNDDGLLWFLTKAKVGHCEYFGTASTLLMRRLGIPARYTVGYVINEKIGKNEYVVRGIHAHAWSTAWIDGQWQIIDSTPTSWIDIQGDKIGLLQRFLDWIQAQGLAFSLWGQRYLSGDFMTYLPLILTLVLLIIIASQLKKTFRRKNENKKPGSAKKIIKLGMDSEFYLLEKRIAAHSESRLPEEPIAAWWQRIRETIPRNTHSDIENALKIHYQHRFDPKGVRDDDRETLRDSIERVTLMLNETVPAK